MSVSIDIIIYHAGTDCQILKGHNWGMATFGEALKAERERQGLSQQRLANLSAVNRSHIASIESTKPGTIEEPEYDTIVRLAAGLGVTPAALLAPTGRSVMEAASVYMVDVESDEIVALFNRLDDADRKRLIAIARALWRLNEG